MCPFADGQTPLAISDTLRYLARAVLSPRLLDLALRYQLASLALGALLALGLWPAGLGGLLGGGLLAAGNFWFLKFAVARLMQDQRPKGAYLFLLGLKFVGVLGLMAVLVLVFALHPVGLGLGLCSLFIGIGAAMGHVLLATPRTSATR